MHRVPVSIVTGALGSGKTTLLNYLLTEHHGVRIGVIVNEFGDVGIDSKLIEASDDEVIELPNGCVCCTVRGDLVQAVKNTLAREVEYILIETSGMAEPGPVANTFLAPELPEIRQQAKLDGIITIVDAEHLEETLAEGETAREQIAAADVVLLNKCDLVKEQDLLAVEARIKEISPRTYIFRTIKTRAPVSILLASGRFDLDRWVAEGRDREVHHEHTPYTAVAVTQEKPLRLDAANAFLRGIPAEVFRAKGVLCIAHLTDPSPEKDLRLVFQKVGKRIEISFDRPWKPGETHRSTLVLIGKDVEKDVWQKRMDDCVRAPSAS